MSNGPVSGTSVPSLPGKNEIISKLTEYKWHILITIGVLVAVWLVYKQQEKKKNKDKDA